MVKHLLALLFSIKLIHWKEMVPRETVLVGHVFFSKLDTWKANPLLNIYSHGNSRLGSRVPEPGEMTPGQRGA